MAKKTISELAARAIAQGLAPHTPAIAVASATRPEQTIIAGTVADIGTKLAANALSGPVLVFIGWVFQGVAQMGPTDRRKAPSDDTLREVSAGNRERAS
jgi:siroheme synthase